MTEPADPVENMHATLGRGEQKRWLPANFLYLTAGGYLLALLMGVYGLLGGYLRDYAGACEGSTAAAHSDAISDFCASGPIVPPLPPHGLWGWIGIGGVLVGLVGLVSTVLRLRMRVETRAGVSKLHT